MFFIYVFDIFNTYFAIRTPEEKYDERARVLKAYDWRNNPVLSQGFDFFNILRKKEAAPI